MSRELYKDNILKIDYNSLHDMIERFKYNYKSVNFIIMNKVTLRYLATDLNNNILYTPFPNTDYHVFEGIPIAICEKLNFGEVEIV